MSLLAPGRNIVLAGMMGSGKTTVGTLLAERLGRPFVDTDVLITEHLKASVPEIFTNEGERVFREEESLAVRTVCTVRGQVIAVGGGALGNPESVRFLRATGDIIVLDASSEVLAERVGGDGAEQRPMLEGADSIAERLERLREQRRDDYAKASELVVDTTGMDAESVADAVLDWARTRPGLLARDEREALE